MVTAYAYVPAESKFLDVYTEPATTRTIQIRLLPLPDIPVFPVNAAIFPNLASAYRSFNTISIRSIEWICRKL